MQHNSQSVLISTYWNVNRKKPDVDNILKIGFNLNLLECKSIFIKVVASGSRVLISTYWNVNFDTF